MVAEWQPFRRLWKTAQTSHGYRPTRTNSRARRSWWGPVGTSLMTGNKLCDHTPHSRRLAKQACGRRQAEVFMVLFPPAVSSTNDLQCICWWTGAQIVSIGMLTYDVWRRFHDRQVGAWLCCKNVVRDRSSQAEIRTLWYVQEACAQPPQMEHTFNHHLEPRYTKSKPFVIMSWVIQFSFVIQPTRAPCSNCSRPSWRCLAPDISLISRLIGRVLSPRTSQPWPQMPSLPLVANVPHSMQQHEAWSAARDCCPPSALPPTFKRCRVRLPARFMLKHRAHCNCDYNPALFSSSWLALSPFMASSHMGALHLALGPTAAPHPSLVNTRSTRTIS